MKRRIDPNMPIGKVTLVKNFLPPPSELTFPSESEAEITKMAHDAREGKGTRKFKDSKAFLRRLWSL